MSREAAPKTCDANNYRTKGDCRRHRPEVQGAPPDESLHCAIFKIGAVLADGSAEFCCQPSSRGFVRFFANTLSADLLHREKRRSHVWPSSQSRRNPV